MKSLLILFAMTCASVVHAEQPRSQEVIDAFLAESQVTAALQQLKTDGWVIGESSATMASTAWNDEGPEGVYLVSVYYEKGDKPWNKRTGVLVGVVEVSMGHIASVKLVDSTRAASLLKKLN